VDPKLLDARVKLLEMYILEKNLKKATQQMKEIFKLAPPSTKIMTLLSGLRLLEGDTDGAETILLSIVNNKPGYIPAYLRLGLLYEATDRPDQALKYFQQAFDMNPRQLGIVKKMAGIYTARQQPAKALDLVDALSEESESKHAPFFSNLKGEIYLSAGQPAKAFALFKQAAEKAPVFISPKMHMARLLTLQNQPQKALELYQKVESLKPDFVPALLAMAFIHDRQGNLDQAEAWYRKVLVQAPGHPDAANNLAFILSEKKGSTDEALELALIAREKAPKNANVLDTMGWIYYQKGNYLNALSELEESLKLNPDSALACFHYGMALYRNQEFKKARQYFRKALDIDPGFRDAATARKMLN
jgi:tetratricopeptide (TPR) repeat protein